MPRFTLDNTQGYSTLELRAMNARFDDLMVGVLDLANAESYADHIAERVCLEMDQVQTASLCGSDEPVEVGTMRYVGRTDATGKCVAHVVTEIAGERRIYDPEAGGMVTIYLYRSRLATAAEASAYLALPRDVCGTWRAAPQA